MSEPNVAGAKGPQAVTRAVLDQAVSALGGHARPGQQRMADEISQMLDDGPNLLVQAGTGTGKSLGYLAPALAHCDGGENRVVIATATLALQAQLAGSDIPNALAAHKEVTGNRIRAAVLKGRTNYACLYRARDGSADPGQASLIGAEVAAAEITDEPSKLGAEVLALREWVESQVEEGALADRDDAPSHTGAAWAQVSIPTRECLGVAKCPFGQECFVELSRERAREAQLIVTNHALLAINAMHGGTALPEHDALIIDEAHELTSRITTAATSDLSVPILERTVKRCLTWLSDDLGADLLVATDGIADALAATEVGRVRDASGELPYAAAAFRDVARRALSALTTKDAEPEQTQAAAALREFFEVAERIAAVSDHDVIWIAESEQRGRSAHAAPLTVAGLLRERVLGEYPTVCTSATLKLGDSFEPFARSIGLQPGDEVAAAANDPLQWRGLDVGSPFEYRKQGILLVARRLPAPGRDGLSEAALELIAELMWASGGRALGLFASRRNAELAAEQSRKALPKLEIMCQGDAQLSELQRRFIAEPESSLFGTMSLWQGVDVPGDTCQLVIIDKIPFPRPDDPLMQARKLAVDEAGGNGFMSVTATHAALLLAQGAGRLIRRASDKGVVAILDSRLATARYGSFLAGSLPDFWQTTDPDIAVQALRRLRGLE